MRALLCITAALAICLSAAEARAQATRTWVSGVGDDVNPCSRTAPCRTFAGAITKTAVAGEIDALDPGEFGILTITKSITIDGRAAPGFAKVVATAAPIVVNVVGPGPYNVVLRGLSIQGRGLGQSGIRFIAGGALHVEDCVLSGFTGNAIDFQPAAGGKLYLREVVARESGGAGLSLSSGSSSAPSLATISGSSAEKNATGFSIGVNGKATAYQSGAFGNVAAGVLVSAPSGGAAEINLEDVAVGNNGMGLEADGLGTAIVRVSNVRLDVGAGSCTQITAAGSIQTFQDNSIACGGCSLLPTLPAPIVGSTYPPTGVTVRGGVGALTWSETGALPAGMAFSGGIFSGTPTTKGTFPITVAATDGNGCAASTPYSLAVTCSPSSILPATLPAGTTAMTYPAQTFTQSGAFGAATVALSGALPIGLTFSAGAISGTPTEAGNFPLTITATDSGGCVSSLSPTLVVNAGVGYQATTLSIASSANPSLFGAALTLTGTVAPPSATPTGSMDFYDGMTLLGSSPVSARQGTLTTSSLSVSSHSIRAVYSGDNVFGGSAASLTQTVSAGLFTLAAPTPTATVAAGATAAYAITISVQGTLAAPVTLACTGLPAGVGCAFNPASTSASGQVTASVAPTATAALAPRTPARNSPRAALALIPLLALGLRRRRRALMVSLLPALLLSFGLGLTSCRDNDDSTVLGARSGTYSFTVVGTSGAIQQTLPLTLIVQ
jgi:Bacterial Ig-like domain (group 3)/Putative Ig domain